MELENRLGLYQVFLRIYEHNRDLLDEILQLEDSATPSLSRTPAYVQGAIQGKEAYIITNLIEGKTQRLFQPEKIWTLGRDNRVALPIRDRWMSRRHAAIQYIFKKGFYLVDLNSTNGTFVNGEPVIKRVLLQDGDRIRFGSLTIFFFCGQTSEMLEPLSPKVLAQINGITSSPTVGTSPQNLTSVPQERQLVAEESEDTPTVLKLKPKFSSEHATSVPSEADLSASVRSDILDRFLANRQNN